MTAHGFDQWISHYLSNRHIHRIYREYTQRGPQLSEENFVDAVEAAVGQCTSPEFEEFMARILPPEQEYPN
jgi:hypothetical protein